MVLLGEGSVGKTAIRQRYLGEGFKGKYAMTLGADFALKRIQVDDILYVTQIWDLAGQSGFRAARKSYYGGAMAGLLVFDIARPPTFEKLDNWIDEIEDNIGELIPLILVGNKSDLRGKSSSEVSTDVAIEYARELSQKIGYRVPYVETSALEGTNIDIAFEELVGYVSKIMEGDVQKGVDIDAKSIQIGEDIDDQGSQPTEETTLEVEEPVQTEESTVGVGVGSQEQFQQSEPMIEEANGLVQTSLEHEQDAASSPDDEVSASMESWQSVESAIETGLDQQQQWEQSEPVIDDSPEPRTWDHKQDVASSPDTPSLKEETPTEEDGDEEEDESGIYPSWYKGPKILEPKYNTRRRKRNYLDEKDNDE